MVCQSQGILNWILHVTLMLTSHCLERGHMALPTARETGKCSL